MKPTYIRRISIKLICSFTVFVFFTAVSSGTKPDTLFLSDEIIKAELHSDFTAINSGRDSAPSYHDGILIYHDDSGIRKLNVKVASRGNFRRDPGNCNFPPLMINFKEKEVPATLFRNQNKLKLVTPCHSDIDVLEEYLIYKMYNKVTNLSLNVRLVNITFFDTGKEKKLFERFSFFVEDEDRAAARNNAVETKKFMTPFDLDREQFSRLSVFQFMIGNKDWYVSSKKNIILMQPEDSTLKPVAVPYDFDFSAFVNASYTRPPDVPLEFLPDRRVYKGVCQDFGDFLKILAFYREIKPEFKSIIENMDLIPRNNLIRNKKYIEEFYTFIEDPENVKARFLETCETPDDYNLNRK